MNRIDKVVVFRSLKEHHLRSILDLELQAVQDRIMVSAGTKFVFQCSDEAKNMLLKEGIDFKYGARHLKRAIERHIVYPLANLLATEQVHLGDLICIDYNKKHEGLTFTREGENLSVPVRKVEPVVPVKVAQAKSGKTVGEPSSSRIPEPAPRMAR
jgi:ATP-dependent Clp protease ATP-binding subunit ClpA